MNPEYLHYLLSAGVIVIMWKVNRTLNRWMDLMIEYPLHRHENGLILFPKGMAPGEVKREHRA
jgi:hypothetical protein